MRALFPCLVALSSFAQGRVTFDLSEVLDNVDLKGPTGTMTTFRCYSGCKVYSPTINADIVILDNAGKQYKRQEESTTLYTLKNNGAPNPFFVFYAVEKGAINYNGLVHYVTSTSQNMVIPTASPLLTVMSATGAVRFHDFKGDFTGAFPSVYATPADQIWNPQCRAVYDAIGALSIPNASFSVLSPIATIDFKKAGDGKSVMISGEPYLTTATGKDKSAVYVSPGYVGCKNVGDSLYTSLPPITSFDSSFTVTDSNGLYVSCFGDYSIANEADAITLSVNNDVQKLFGSTSDYKKTYAENSFQIGLKWSKKEGSTDRFSMQIDVMAIKDAKDE